MTQRAGSRTGLNQRPMSMDTLAFILGPPRHGHSAADRAWRGTGSPATAAAPSTLPSNWPAGSATPRGHAAQQHRGHQPVDVPSRSP